MATLSLLGTVAVSAVLGLVWLDDRHVAMEQYSQDMKGLIMQQRASERWQIKRDIRGIKSGAHGRALTPMEADDLQELNDRLQEITPDAGRTSGN